MSEQELLSIKNVIDMHDDILDEYHGMSGIRDEGLLDSAVNQIRQGFGDQELYPSVIDKACRLAYATIKNHPFADGNKRTAVLSMLTVLEMNGYDTWFMNDDELAELIEDVASGIVSYECLVDTVILWYASIVPIL